MEGYPVGAAMESINRRYVELASELASELVSEFLADPGVTKAPQFPEDRQAQIEMYAARNIVLLGDPAVSLVVDAGENEETPNPTTLSRPLQPDQERDNDPPAPRTR